MFIFYSTEPYARRIPRALRVTSLFPKKNLRSRRRNDMSVYVNWGCSRRTIDALHLNKPVLNADISGSACKMKTFEILQAAGLPYPRIVKDPKEVTDGVPFYTRGKYLGRADYLSGGEGIVVYEKGTLPKEGVKHDFYSQVVSKQHEVRIHCAIIDDVEVIICEQFKYIPAGSGILIRNFDNGARFSARPLHTRLPQAQADEAHRLVFAALRACNLDFAAFDLALTQKGQWIIFEANSAPGLTERDDLVEGYVPVEGENQYLSTYDAYEQFFRQFLIERPAAMKKIKR